MKQNRINLVIKRMVENNIDQAIITDPYSIFYLTDVMIHPGERFYGLLVDTNGEHKLFINALFPLDDKIAIDKIVFSDVDNIINILSNYVRDNSTLGVDKILPARFLLPLINKLNSTNFVDISLIVDEIRMIKDEQEKELMRKSSLLNDKACELLINSIEENDSELDVKEKLLNIYKQLGVEGLSFDPIIAYGANGANPHAEAGQNKLKDGDAIIIDMGGIKNNYCSDMTRTVFWKETSPKAKEVFEVVLEAQKRGVAAVRPGVKFSEIDAACRDYITEKGYGEYFTHRTGHHIGLECHEYGDISSASNTECKPGMIFSIEPGVYLPNEFGVRIEDLVLVTEDGCEVLNKLDKELLVIGKD